MPEGCLAAITTPRHTAYCLTTAATGTNGLGQWLNRRELACKSKDLSLSLCTPHQKRAIRGDIHLLSQGWERQIQQIPGLGDQSTSPTWWVRGQEEALSHKIKQTAPEEWHPRLPSGFWLHPYTQEHAHKRMNFSLRKREEFVLWITGVFTLTGLVSVFLTSPSYRCYRRHVEYAVRHAFSIRDVRTSARWGRRVLFSRGGKAKPEACWGFPINFSKDRHGSLVAKGKEPHTKLKQSNQTVDLGGNPWYESDSLWEI